MHGSGARIPLWFGTHWHGTKVESEGVPFVSWLILPHRLLTKDRLLKIGIACDPIFVHCQKECETIEQLFFGCEYTIVVYNQMLGASRSVTGMYGRKRI